MKITFLGSGSHFVLGKENYHSNILIEDDNCTLLYDAGTTINDSLDNVNKSVGDLECIFLSHLHGDHSGGMEFIGFKSYFLNYQKEESKIEVISSEKILKDLWSKQLAGGMETFNGKSDIHDFFDIREFKKSRGLMDVGGLKIKPIKTNHSENSP